MSSNGRKPYPGAVDSRRQDLFEGSELLGKRRLEVEAELNSGNHRQNLFPVLSGSGEENSGRLIGAENVRSQIASRDHVVGGLFEPRPPGSIEKDLISQPVRDVLLADRPLQGITETLRKGDLAATCKVDRSSKGSNVRFIHEHALYTNRFVRVNEPVCMTPHKPACTVLPMRTTTRKGPEVARSNKRIAQPGPDGKTLGQRVSEAMAHETDRRGTAYIQKHLIEDVNRLAAADDESAPVLSQAMASAIMLGKVTRSTFTPYIAKACHVDAVWLARGIGQMIPKA